MNDNLWELLAVNESATATEIHQAYLQKKDRLAEKNQLRLAWKILADPFYASLYKKGKSVQQIVAAGFLDNSFDYPLLDSPCADPRWLSTPVNKVQHNLHSLKKSAADSPLFVLLATGGFDPLHKAHIEMMEIAKVEIEQHGGQVIGGYISPCHDSYTRQKPSPRYDASQRIHLAFVATAESHWLSVAPWEALYLPCTTNFTDVLLHLQRYLAYHFSAWDTINVCYVFGADNAAFSHTFSYMGHAVCVRRPGCDQVVQEVMAQHSQQTRRNTVFSRESTSGDFFSARYCRLSQTVDDKRLPTAVCRQLANWRTVEAKPAERVYVLRDEGSELLKPWMEHRESHSLIRQRNVYVERVKQLFAEILNCQVKVITVQQQLSLYKKWLQAENTISLDRFFPGKYHLDLSRCYGFADAQFDGRADVGARPGYGSIEQQTAVIAKGEYVLIDDDIATGTTVEWLKKVLKGKGIVINKVINLTSGFYEHETIYDVCDLRDFLLGSVGGGLVCEETTGQAVRLPYCLPYVNVNNRASIPLCRQKEFSLKIWQYNAEFHQAIEKPILLAETDNAFLQAMLQLGFSPESNLQSLCNWHIDRLTATANF